MTPDPLTPRPLSVKAPPSKTLKSADVDDVIMTLLSLSPDPLV